MRNSASFIHLIGFHFVTIQPANAAIPGSLRR